MPNATQSQGRGDALNVSGMPFKFNPPIHPSLYFHYPSSGEYTTSQIRASMQEIYDEASNTYGASAATSTFQNLRLGRIAMSDESLAFALKDKTRFGFRFLYNPTTVSGGVTVGTDFIPDQSNTVTAVLQEGLETINFELLLNRVPEVMGTSGAGDYGAPISNEELGELRRRGTHYDIEYLYRVCNGVHNIKARSNTGDIGILLPNPCELFLGPLRSRGAILAISVVDQMFSPDMVPMISFVNIQFARYLTTSSEGIARDGTGGSAPSIARASALSLKSDESVSNFMNLIRGGFLGGLGVLANYLGDVVEDVVDAVTPGGGGGEQPVAPIPATGAKLTGAQVERLARDVGFAPDLARTMTQIAWGESGWNTHAHNPNRGTGDNSYGIWQINMIETYQQSRLKQFGIKTNEELFNPQTNARAAMSLYKGQGLKAWTVYTTGKYKRAPSW